VSEQKLIEFGNYLKHIRKEKGLSLRKLEELSGVSNAYLSQLENGKRGMPTPEILKKICGPLEVPYEELMEKAGYIDLNKETVTAIKENNLDDLITSAAEIFIKSLSDEDKRNIVNQIQDVHQVDKNTAEDLVSTTKLFENLTVEEKVSFLDMVVNDFKNRNIDTKTVFTMNQNTVKTLRVPVLGHIAAGSPLLADEHIEDWMDIPNTWGLKAGEVIVLKVKGDSMIGSRIYDGDKVVVRLQQDVENGEIAVVNVNGDEATLKRVKKSQNGQTFLYPDNPKYDPIVISHEGARIIGKVIQVMFEPR
jgi:repressor LexA